MRNLTRTKQKKAKCTVPFQLLAQYHQHPVLKTQTPATVSFLNDDFTNEMKWISVVVVVVVDFDETHKSINQSLITQ